MGNINGETGAVTKDPMILFKNTQKKAKESGNGDMLSVSLIPEEVTSLLQALEGALAVAGADPKKRVAIDIHTGTKQGPSGPFLSSYAFVKVIELKERNTANKYGNQNKSGGAGSYNNSARSQTAAAVSKVTNSSAPTRKY